MRLIAAARQLWAARSYAEVGTPEIVAAAGVTRGAMYHQFADKAALFLAVMEAVEQDVVARLAKAIGAIRGPPPPLRRSARRSSRGWTSVWIPRYANSCSSMPPACSAASGAATSPSATASA